MAGAIAGAAGTAALNAATYLDVAVRGRPSSGTAQEKSAGRRGPFDSVGAKWSTADWLSDLVPHLVYGAVVAATLRALDR